MKVLGWLFGPICWAAVEIVLGLEPGVGVAQLVLFVLDDW